MVFASPFHRRPSLKAFTLVELLVATTIITLVAVSATLNLTRIRETSRDGRRRSDIQVYSQAIAAYQLAKGSLFIQYPGGTGCSVSAPTGAQSDTIDSGTGTGCVGADGRSYGFVNLVGNGSSATTGGIAYTTTPASSDPGRTYTSHSIAEALNASGFLNKIATDPLSKMSGTNNSDPTQPDYVIIRCCKDGRQSVTQAGSAYGIWANFETTPNSTDIANAGLICGGTQAAANIDSHYASNVNYPKPYQYDFADGTTTKPNFAVGSTIGVNSMLCPSDNLPKAS